MKNQDLPFLDIQNKFPCVRLFPTSMGTNTCGGFDFWCLKKVDLDFSTPPYIMPQNPSSVIPGPVIICYMSLSPFFGTFLLYIWYGDNIQPITKSTSLIICFKKVFFLQEQHFYIHARSTLFPLSWPINPSFEVVNLILMPHFKAKIPYYYGNMATKNSCLEIEF